MLCQSIQAGLFSDWHYCLLLAECQKLQSLVCDGCCRVSASADRGVAVDVHVHGVKDYPKPCRQACIYALLASTHHRLMCELPLI